MRVVTDCARHSPLEMRTGLPFLYIEAIPAVTAAAQVAGTINRHRVGRRVSGMCGWHRAMAGCTGHAILFPRSQCRVVPGHVANKTGAGFSLVRPHLVEEWGAGRMSMFTQ